jgi:hypothetical protein
MRVVLVVVAVTLAACGPSKPPPATKPPAQAPPVSDAVELRYAARALAQDLELELTDTRVGHYVEARLRLAATLELAVEGKVLRSRWSLAGVDALELTGTVAANEHHEARGMLLTKGSGVAIGDVHGVVDQAATDADPVNVARIAAMGAKKAPPAGVLLLGVLAELIRLPRLPDRPLRVGEPVELEEESETVVVDADTELVLPTTTVYRFTLRRLDEQGTSRVAEIELQIASLAQPEGDAAEPVARLESRAEGTLLLDVDQGVPVSLELSRTESFTVGEAARERSVTLRSRFHAP